MTGTEVQILLLILFAISAMLGTLVLVAWLIIRSGITRSTITACMLAALVVSGIPVLWSGRIITDWPKIIVSVFVIGLPVGVLWESERRHQRKLSADKSAP